MICFGVVVYDSDILRFLIKVVCTFIMHMFYFFFFEQGRMYIYNAYVLLFFFEQGRMYIYNAYVLLFFF